MISLKRLEAMRHWLRYGGDDLVGQASTHAAWAVQAGLLRVESAPERKWLLVPTDALAPAIAKAEQEHARHRTVERRERARREADYRYLLHLAECRLAMKDKP